ncbi:MAG: histone H1 [Ignavibacteria bacterium]|nr:histone H1 [Ignavibacteria bacterium]
MEKYKQLLDAVQAMEADFHKFYEKEQSAAGTRIRKSLSDLKKLAQDLRENVQETKNSRKG